MDEIDEVLDIAQRQKRAQIMRRYSATIERKRKIAQRKLAPEKNIKKRAYAQARQAVRKKFAGARGAEYEKLGPSEKMAIDRAIEQKTALIKKLALKLIPKIKQAEAKRLQSFTKGQALKNQGQKEGKKTVNELFTESFPPMADTSARQLPNENNSNAKGDIQGKAKKKAKSGDIIIYNKFGEELVVSKSVFEGLSKKAEKSGIDIETLGEVYARGSDAWTDGGKYTQQQYAFARVNSYINEGSSYYDLDADLHGEELTEKRGLWDNIHAKRKRIKAGSGERMRKPGSKGAPTDQDFKNASESVEIDELSKTTIKSYLDKNEPSAEKAMKIVQSNAPEKKWNKALGTTLKRHAGERLASKKLSGKAKVNATEEVESIDEISKTLAKNYFNKVNTSAQKAKDFPSDRKVENRREGKNLAMAKNAGVKSIWGKKPKVAATNEDAQIDELSTPLLHSYLDKAKKTTPMQKQRKVRGSDPAEHKEAERKRVQRNAYMKTATKNISKKYAAEETEAPGTKIRKNMEIVDRKPKTPGVYTKQAEVKTKIIDEEGNSQNDPKKRLQGTDSLVKAYKKDTPGESGGLNESFNIAFATGIGVSLTAADLGMKAQGGFALHPSVIAEMESRELEEDAVSAEKKPVYMPPRKKQDGSYTPAKTVLRKTNRKIIDVQEPQDVDSDEHDGK